MGFLQNFSKTLAPNVLKTIAQPHHQLLHQKLLWGYVAIAFNRVDADRQRLVGPDRLCAEWIIKNGGAIGFLGMHGKLFKDYNSLPPDNVKLRIQVVDASGASIMKIGLDHFRGCKHIDTAIFHNCMHLEGDGLEGLVFLKDTLRKLQVSGCYNIRDEGLLVIGEMKKLTNLKIFDMRYVKNLEAVIEGLRKRLPNCEITTVAK